jgi:hypothetical protein
MITTPHESDLARTRRPGGCTSHVNMSTALQRERSNTHKVTSEHSTYEKRYFTYVGFGHLFVEVSKVLRLPPQKMSLASEVLHLVREIIIMYQSKITAASQKDTEPIKTSSKFTKYCACHEK